MQQILIIHGGTSLNSHEEYINFIKTRDLTLDRLRQNYDWKASFQNVLGDNFDVLQPKMPNSTNARYAEWKLWLERCLELVNENIIFIGHSLGGIFLAKYLSEETCPKTIKATILIAAPFDDVLTDEKLTDFTLPDSLDTFSKQSKNIHLFHSKDDPIVPFGDIKKYQTALPNAKLHTFKDRSHFHQGDLPELTELVKQLSA